jgi:lipoyl(octanoyl) transferase
MMEICETYRLGKMPFDAAWSLQKTLAQARAGDACSDSLLLLEHPHTYTLGSSGKQEHLLMTEAERARRGVAVHVVDRGGDITYHGPGQLVGYPIIRLPQSSNRFSADVVAYVRRLETMLGRALATFGIEGRSLEGYTGVWVNHAGVLSKIAAIGVRVTVHRVTLHGFALNVNTDLDYFQGIIPCGIADKPVTSMAAVLGQPVEMNPVMDAVEAAFAEVFLCTLRDGDVRSRT